MLPELPDFQSTNVLVVGDVILDRYWHGSTQRISPEAPVPIVKIETEEARAGGAGNVALNIAALGAQAHLIGLCGTDEPAETLEKLLTRSGVRHNLIKHPSSPTITKLRIISRNQQLIRLDFEKRFPPENASLVVDTVKSSLHKQQAIVLSDYAKGTLKDAPEIIKAARSRSIPIIIDPKGTSFDRYRGATVLTPNLSEFEAVAGPCPDEMTLTERGERLRADLTLTALLITRSERGMTLLCDNRPPLHLPARAREVFDVTGAGDTVVAILATCLASGMTIEEATHLANLGAGIVVGKFGTASVSREELRAAAEDHISLPTGIVAEEELIRLVSLARQAGERIVMTNGCFDLLHPGHITYLRQARLLGDRLIVAVNDDNSVRRLKGEERPINPLSHRMQMLAALSSVDWVVSFKEDTPENLICRLKPDVLVKGGDYRPDNIAGAQCVRDNGGEIRVLPFLEGHSTTRIIDRIRGVA